MVLCGIQNLCKKIENVTSNNFQKNQKHSFNATILGSPPESEDEEGYIPESPHTDKRQESDAGTSGSSQAILTDADIEVLRGKFPILRELSSGFIKGLTPTELMNLEKASMKRGQAEKFKDAKTS
jgi:hypothetical protein